MRLPLARCFVTAAGGRGPRTMRPQPRGGGARAPDRSPRFGLAPFRSPLLGGSRLISLPRGTEMFQFPRLPSLDGTGRPRGLGSPIRRPRDRSPRAAPPGLSRLAASFFGFPCQGIRRAPLLPSRPFGRGAGACVGPDFHSDRQCLLACVAMRLSRCPGRAPGAGRCDFCGRWAALRDSLERR